MKRSRKSITTNVTLAHKYNPSKHTLSPNNWTWSEKLDGIRAYVNDDTTDLCTRNGNIIVLPDDFKQEILRFKLRFDGELYLDRGKFQETVSIVRKTKNMNPDEWHPIKFMVFDLVEPQMPFSERYNLLKDKLEDHPRIQLVQQHEMPTDLFQLLKEKVNEGAEGLMLRDQTSLYEFKRSHSLLKMKMFLDAEATIIGFELGKGRLMGKMGAIICQMDNGKTFKIGSGFTDEQRTLNSLELKKGDLVTYRYFELTTKGVPRFPTFIARRDDL